MDEVNKEEYDFREFTVPLERIELKLPTQKEKRYNSVKPTDFSVEEIGRHHGQDEVSIETWSKDCGRPIPEACKIPMVKPPIHRRLPLSLELKSWYHMDRVSSLDVTNPTLRHFKLYQRTKKITDSIPEYFSIGKILIWALRENVGLSDCDVIASSCVVRELSTAALFNKELRFSVGYYRGKLFIDVLLI